MGYRGEKSHSVSKLTLLSSSSSPFPSVLVNKTLKKCISETVLVSDGQVRLENTHWSSLSSFVLSNLTVCCDNNNTYPGWFLLFSSFKSARADFKQVFKILFLSFGELFKMSKYANRS